MGNFQIKDLDDDLHREIRIEAVRRGEDMKALAVRALVREINRLRQARGEAPFELPG